tara:strand:+ start:262 stop:663 length:402 start_codon:yes stop_codon:yes gene_type:complete
MAITITDRALEIFTELYQDPVNKYIRLYSQKLVFEDSDTLSGNDVGTVIPILAFPVISLDKEVLRKDFCHYTADTRTGKTISQSGQTSASDNQQQIGSLDLYLTWSDDDNSFVGNSTINFDENANMFTIDVTS